MMLIVLVGKCILVLIDDQMHQSSPVKRMLRGNYRASPLETQYVPIGT